MEIPTCLINTSINKDNDWHNAILERVEGRNMRVKFYDETKDAADDEDVLTRLSLLSDKFQGKSVFMGGNNAVVNLAEIEIVIIR